MVTIYHSRGHWKVQADDKFGICIFPLMDAAFVGMSPGEAQELAETLMKVAAL